MERANHINIAMTDDPTTNGMPKSKVIFTVDKSWQPMGAVVSFHDIQYKVVVKSGPLCKRKVTPRGILVDLKYACTHSHAHTRTHACMHTLARMHTHAHMHTHARTHTLARTHAHTRAHALWGVVSVSGSYAKRTVVPAQ